VGRFGLDGVLLFGSTPYAKRGVLYDGWSEYHGNDTGEALCWVSPTRTMNPTFSQELIDRELKKDRASAGAEYLAECATILRASFPARRLRRVLRLAFASVPSCQHALLWLHRPCRWRKDAFTVAVGTVRATRSC